MFRLHMQSEQDFEKPLVSNKRLKIEIPSNPNRPAEFTRLQDIWKVPNCSRHFIQSAKNTLK